jgi:hypothetical protein
VRALKAPTYVASSRISPDSYESRRLDATR